MNYIKEQISKKKYRGTQLTNSKVAQLLNCSNTDISNYIAENRTPNHSRLMRLCQILKCSIKDLYPNAKKNYNWDLL